MWEGSQDAAQWTNNYPFGIARPTEMTPRPKCHQFPLLGLKIPQTQHPSRTPHCPPGSAVQTTRRTAGDEGLDLLGWRSSGSDEQLGSWRRQLLWRRGLRATWRGSWWPTTGVAWRSAQSPSNGCCLFGCEPGMRSSPRRRGAVVRLQVREEAALRCPL